MKTKHDLTRVKWYAPGGEKEADLTPRAVRAVLLAPWPANLESLSGWWTEALKNDLTIVARKKRKAVPRGAAFEAELTRKAAEHAGAVLAELELHKLIFTTTAGEWNRYRSGAERLLIGPEDGEWYALGAVLDNLRKPDTSGTEVPFHVRMSNQRTRQQEAARKPGRSR